jgi:hypothetical protein
MSQILQGIFHGEDGGEKEKIKKRGRIKLHSPTHLNLVESIK